MHLSVSLTVHRVRNDPTTCFGKTKILFSSLKAKQILYNSAVFWSPLCMSAFVTLPNSFDFTGFGANTTFERHSLLPFENYSCFL